MFLIISKAKGDDDDDDDDDADDIIVDLLFQFSYRVVARLSGGA